MKKIYLAPALRERLIEASTMLCGSVTGGTDNSSIGKENEEDLVKRSGTSSANPVKSDDWD